MFPEGRLLDFLIVGAVALIVVGPKDLPVLMRKVGQFVARMRGMAAEFRASFDELARQSELDELRKEVEAMRRAGTVQGASEAIVGDHTQAVFDDIHAGLRSGEAQFHPPLSPAAPGLADPSPGAVAEATPPAAPPAPQKPRKPRTPANRPSARKSPAVKARAGTP
jgi:sec-independent protein translocase protein TatB